MKSTQRRREFLKNIFGVSVLVAGADLILSACASSSSTSTGTGTSPVAGGDCAANGTSISVGTTNGHSHLAPTITSTDVTNGTTQQFVLGAGAAGHTHTMTVANTDFTTLQGNMGVQVETDTDSTGHTHSVTINCA